MGVVQRGMRWEDGVGVVEREGCGKLCIGHSLRVSVSLGLSEDNDKRKDWVRKTRMRLSALTALRKRHKSRGQCNGNDFQLRACRAIGDVRHDCR